MSRRLPLNHRCGQRGIALIIVMGTLLLVTLIASILADQGIAREVEATEHNLFEERARAALEGTINFLVSRLAGASVAEQNAWNSDAERAAWLEGLNQQTYTYRTAAAPEYDYALTTEVTVAAVDGDSIAGNDGYVDLTVTLAIPATAEVSPSLARLVDSALPLQVRLCIGDVARAARAAATSCLSTDPPPTPANVVTIEHYRHHF